MKLFVAQAKIGSLFFDRGSQFLSRGEASSKSKISHPQILYGMNSYHLKKTIFYVLIKHVSGRKEIMKNENYSGDNPEFSITNLYLNKIFSL